MTTIISSKSAKFAAGLVGLVAGVAMFAITAQAATFTTNLKQGSTGADVKNLQILLNSAPSTQVATTGAGSPGNESSYFGPATKAAVIKFQNKYASEVLAPVGLTSGTGFVGAATRAKLNTMGGSTSTTTTVPGCTSTVGFSPTTGQSCATGAVTTTTTTTQSGPISVSLANDNPAASAVVASQATADLAHFTFSGNGTIKNVKLLRTGISSNSTLSSVYLYQGSVRVSDGASVNNTDSSITFNNLSIAVNGSATLSVKADIAANTAGQIVGVQLVGYTVSGATAMNTANISGNYMNVASAALAGATASSTSAVTATVNAGTIGQTFWSGAVNVSTRAVSLKGAAFKFIGSATSDAATKLQLYVNGLPVGSTASVDSVTNRLSFDFGTSPVTLNTGSQTVELRGDIVKGSNRTIQFNLENASDLITMDSQLGVNIAVTAPTTLTFAAQNGTTVSVSTGSVTTTIDPSFSTVTTVTGGATGAVIGKFKVTAYGEDVKVSTLAVLVTGTGATPTFSGLNNVALFYNGSQVGSSQNAATSTELSFTLGSSLIVAAGTSGTLEVRADLQNSASANYTAGTVTVALNVGSANGQGQASSATMNVPTATVTSTGLTVATGALSVSTSAAYAAAQTVNPNTANVKLGSYVLQNTSSSEGVRVTNLAVTVGGTQSLTYLSNLRTSETSGSGSTPINPTASNNFSVNFTLAPGQSKVIDIMGDLGAGISASTTITTLLPTAIGSNSNVAMSLTAVTGQTLTAQSGTLAVPTLVTSGSLVAQYIVGGTSPVTSQYKFVATNGTATISELKFAVGGTAGTSSVTQVSVGGATAPVVNGVAYATGLNIVVPAGASGTNVTVTPTFASVGNNGLTSFTQATTSLTYMKYTIGGTTTSTSTLAVVSNTMTLVGSKPTVTATQPSGVVLTTGNVEVIDVTVSADSAGPITLNSLPIVATLNSTGGLFTAAAAVVKDGNNNTVATTGSCTSAITCTVTIAFTGGREITSTPQTFKIFLPVSVVASTSSSPNNAVNTTITPSSAAFSWTDTQGNNGTPITEAAPLIYNFPTLTSNIHN